MSATELPRVLTVGTCDFDNFGDLLMLLITEKYLVEAQAHVVPGATFGWDVTTLLDRRVHAYGQVLENERFDAIWTVGGETGGGYQIIEQLFRWTAPPQVYQEFENSALEQREQIVRRNTGSAHIVCPHIPSPVSYPHNSGAVTVINSMGLSQLLHSGNILPYGEERKPLSGWEWDQLISMLRHTNFVSVRDKESSDLLAALGIEHRVAPDLVHALARLHPLKGNPESDIAIFQIKSWIVSKLGAKNVAEALVRSENLRGLRIRVLQAGNLRDDDSAEVNEELVEYIKHAEPTKDVQLIKDRNPFDLIDHIANARIAIGSSHHVRVVASAYKIPRVTLSINSLRRNYASFWDSGMPYDVSLQELDDAIGKALTNAGKSANLARSDRLSRLAYDNLEYLAHQTMSLLKSKKDNAG